LRGDLLLKASPAEKSIKTEHPHTRPGPWLHAAPYFARGDKAGVGGGRPAPDISFDLQKQAVVQFLVQGKVAAGFGNKNLDMTFINFIEYNLLWFSVAAEDVALLT